MFKRIRWMMLGAIGGVAAYLWAKRRMGEVLPQASEEVARRTQAGLGRGADRLNELGSRLAEAVAEGRRAMRDEQARLEAELLTR